MILYSPHHITINPLDSPLDCELPNDGFVLEEEIPECSYPRKNSMTLKNRNKQIRKSKTRRSSTGNI